MVKYNFYTTPNASTLRASVKENEGEFSLIIIEH